MDNKLFNDYINVSIESVTKEQIRLKEKEKNLRGRKKSLKNSLHCEHDIVVDRYSDYHSKITTYYCKKCKFLLEF